MSMTLSHFLELTATSQLLNHDQLADALARFRSELKMHLPQDAELAAFCDYLITQELLSKWQCEKLCLGRWKGYFLDKYKIIEWIDTSPNYDSNYLAEDTRTGERVDLLITPPGASKDGKIRYRIVRRDQQR
jgi:serine/threonine-protein kinase